MPCCSATAGPYSPRFQITCTETGVVSPRFVTKLLRHNDVHADLVVARAEALRHI